ncbi:hypothetical protein J7J95_02030 [bacterium]|nr:hypothetical protein [bacterium]
MTARRKLTKTILENTKVTWVVAMIIALIVIGESIWIVDYLNREEGKGKVSLPKRIVNLQKKEKEQKPVAKIAVLGAGEIKLGKPLKVNLVIQNEKDLEKLEGMDIVIRYNPELFRVLPQKVKAEAGLFETIARTLVEQEKGRVVISFLNGVSGEKKETKITAGEHKLATITFDPLAVGKGKIEVLLPKEGQPAGSKIINTEGKELPLAKEDLLIVVSNQ